MRTVASLTDALFQRDAHGLSMRVISLGRPLLNMKISTLHGVAPNAFCGRRAELHCVSGGRRVSLGCVIDAPEGMQRMGLDYHFSLRLDEPERFDELGFDGCRSRVLTVTMRVGGLRYEFTNLYARAPTET